MSARRSVTLALRGLGAAVLCAAPAIAQPVLAVQGSCPGQVLARVDGAQPRKGILLLYAPHSGNFRLPWYHWCAGTELGLNPRGIRIVDDTVADENGRALFEGTAPAGACGGFLQTLNTPSGDCETSNVVQIE